VASGNASGDRGSSIFFALEGLQINPWKFIPSQPTLLVERPVWLCVACGHFWSSIDPIKAILQIRTYGSEALKAQLLELGETLPRPAAAPKSDDRALPLPAAQGKDEG